MVLILVENLIFKTMRILLFIILLPLVSLSQNFFVNQSEVSFFSSAPIEDISAISNRLEGVVDFENSTFFFRVPITTFIFPSSLMQKHFNEKYMESDIYDISSFKGIFKEKVTISNFQNQIIKAEGALNIHGVSQDISIHTELMDNNEVMSFHSEFKVVLKDFNIKVPKIVMMNIADTILVRVSGTLIEKE